MIPIVKRLIVTPPFQPIVQKVVMPTTVLNLTEDFINVTNLSLTLSEPGIYRLGMHMRSTVNLPGKFVSYRFFNQTTSTVLADSELICGHDNPGTFTNSQNMASTETFLTITSATTITVQASGSTATGCGVTSGSVGRSLMTAIGYRV